MLRFFDDPLHLIVLLAVVLIVFGAGKLPSVGSALGQSIKEFKKASNEPEAGSSSIVAGSTCKECQSIIPSGAQFCPSCGAPVHPQVSAPPTTVYCSQCGAQNAPTARFCAQCGTGVNVHAG